MMLRLIPIALACMTLSCGRDTGPERPAAVAVAPPPVTVGGLYPGGGVPLASFPNRYEESAHALNEGRRLYSWFNCEGCHFLGGGGIGPALMDEDWIYGSGPANVFATIVEGRPNGMPSFRNKIPEYQVWQLVAFVRSMSGQVSKGVAPGREDHMSAHPAPQSMPRQKPRQSGSEQ